MASIVNDSTGTPCRSARYQTPQRALLQPSHVSPYAQRRQSARHFSTTSRLSERRASAPASLSLSEDDAACRNDSHGTHSRHHQTPLLAFNSNALVQPAALHPNEQSTVNIVSPAEATLAKKRMAAAKHRRSKPRLMKRVPQLIPSGIKMVLQLLYKDPAAAKAWWGRIKDNVKQEAKRYCTGVQHYAAIVVSQQPISA